MWYFQNGHGCENVAVTIIWYTQSTLVRIYDLNLNYFMCFNLNKAHAYMYGYFVSSVGWFIRLSILWVTNGDIVNLELFVGIHTLAQEVTW